MWVGVAGSEVKSQRTFYASVRILEFGLRVLMSLTGHVSAPCRPGDSFLCHGEGSLPKLAPPWRFSSSRAALMLHTHWSHALSCLTSPQHEPYDPWDRIIPRPIMKGLNLSTGGGGVPKWNESESSSSWCIRFRLVNPGSAHPWLLSLERLDWIGNKLLKIKFFLILQILSWQRVSIA